MKTLLAAFSAITLAASAASACEFHAASAHDAMTTASIEAPMSTRDDGSSDAIETTEMTGGVAAEEIREEPAE